MNRNVRAFLALLSAATAFAVVLGVGCGKEDLVFPGAGTPTATGSVIGTTTPTPTGTLTATPRGTSTPTPTGSRTPVPTATLPVPCTHNLQACVTNADCCSAVCLGVCLGG